MSAAKQCDRCGALFAASEGLVSIGSLFITHRWDAASDWISDTWSDLDFCGECSAAVLQVIEPALGGRKDDA